MKKKDIIRSIVIEVILVAVAAFGSFQLCQIFAMKYEIMPLVIAVSYAVMKFLVYGFLSRLLHGKDNTDALSILQTKGIMQNSIDKRLELFNYEYQQEQLMYQLQKEKEDDLKLQAVLKYTRETFKRLEFEPNEIFQICESVRYFVINSCPLSMTETRIKRRSYVTQISLKNFAWNIAFQYNISGDATTAFVMQTFSEWFINCTFETVRKNLRTTGGRHQIMIDEHIMRITSC